MRLVKIKWLDAHGDGGAWMATSEIKPRPYMSETVGFVAAEDEDFVCVIQSRGDDDQHYNHLCIPKGTIRATIDL